MSPAPPVTFGVPAEALPAWHRLSAALDADGRITPCQGADRDLWVGGKKAQQEAADRCVDCPVMVLCGQYATAAAETTGAWGGVTETERRARKKKVNAA